MTARAIAALAAGIVALSGCGSEGSSTVSGGADADAVGVIKAWADELRAGDVEAAAERFQIPVIVQNGTPPLRLTNRSEVVGFNKTLPCGAELIRAEREGRFTVATFRLTERPGPGRCGVGTDETARTAFVIHNDRITEWRRVADQPPGEQAPQGPVI
ncbi:MAG: hypothetical protein ACJ75Z_05380 [Solirubrobacterales bacterium]